jgi:histidyl-tRNA synthetase
MVKNFSLPRGTADIFPAEMSVWQTIEGEARRVLNNYNYKEIRTPLFEETALFKRSLGQTSDVVNKQLLELVSAKEEGFALRPEGTASVVRAYVENSLDRKENISKFFYIGPMFRGERPQKGRLRQFHQIGVEVVGPGAAHPFLDAEIIALNVNLLQAFGITDFELKLNTLGSPADKESFSENLRKLFKEELPHLCPDCQQRFDRNVFRLLDCKNKACRDVARGLKIDHSYLSPESRAYFSQVQEALDSLGVKYRVCFDLVRGLDYYTHTVFEVTVSSLGSQDAVSAGGRYNNLVSQLGGADVPAVGFALGMERVILGLPAQLSTLTPPNTYIIALDEKSFKKAYQILDFLRRNDISSDMSYRLSSMKSQMRGADKCGARSVIILGEAELAKEVVSFKDMATGYQKEMPIQDNDYSVLAGELKERYA